MKTLTQFILESIGLELNGFELPRKNYKNINKIIII